MRYKELLLSNPKNPSWAQGHWVQKVLFGEESENLTMHFANSGQAI